MGERKKRSRYAGSAKELHAISSPFPDPDLLSVEANDKIYDERLDGMRVLDTDDVELSERGQRLKRQKHEPEARRGMPFLNVIRSETAFPSQEFHGSEKSEIHDPRWLRLQYLGQIVVGYIVQILRSLNNSERLTCSLQNMPN